MRQLTELAALESGPSRSAHARAGAGQKRDRCGDRTPRGSARGGRDCENPPARRERRETSLKPHRNPTGFTNVPASDALDGHALGVRRKRFQVAWVGRQHRSARLRHRDNQRVDRGTTSCAPSKQGSSSRETLRDPIDHVAGLEQLVLVRISARMPLKALDQDNRRNRSGPETFLPKGKNERRGRAGPLGEATDRSRIQNEHVLTSLARRPLGDSLCKRLCSGPLTWTWLTHLGEQLGGKTVGFRKQVKTADLCSNGALQQLGGRKTALFHETVELVRQINLHAWHTPKYTPSASGINGSSCAAGANARAFSRPSTERWSRRRCSPRARTSRREGRGYPSCRGRVGCPR